MTTCKATYNGTKDRETVESFLTAVRVFKPIEHISDEDALTGLPLVFKDEAAVWWLKDMLILNGFKITSIQKHSKQFWNEKI